MNFTVKPLDSKFVENQLDYEQYVLVYSKQLSKIFEPDIDMMMEPNKEVLDKFVTISFGKKKIYRKCKSRYGVNSNEVEIGYRTQVELSCSNGDAVSLEPTCWFLYYWKNSSPHKRMEFQILCISLILAIVSGVISLLSLFIHLPLIG